MAWYWWLVLALVLAVCYVAYTQRAIGCDPTVPTLPTLPLVGNLRQFVANADRYYHFLVELQARGGPFHGRSFGMSIPGHPPILQMLTSEANCRYVLKDNFANYPIGDNRMALLSEIFGNGIFGSNGPAWRSHRKAAANIFTLRLLRDDMCPILIDHGNRLVARLREAAARAEAVDMQDLFFRHTMDSFSEIAFGEDLATIEQSTPHPFARSFDVTQHMMLHRFFDPFWRWKRSLNVGSEREIAAQLAVMNRHAHAFIARRRADLAAVADGGSGGGATQRNDLISHFLNAAKKEGRDMTDAELRDLIINFMIAGRDTTAVALSWFMREMAANPRARALVVAEVDRAMAGRDGVPDFQTATELSYTEAALLESLRLHPSVPGDDRTALKDDKLPDGTIVKAGTAVSFNPYCFGHSEQLWGADVEEYRPERWLGKAADPASPEGGDRKAGDAAAGDGDGSGFDRAASHLKAFSQYQFPTFSGGLRLCMGRGLALLEAKLAIAQLFSAFELDLVPGQKFEFLVSVTMSIVGGIRMVPRLRRPPSA